MRTTPVLAAAALLCGGAATRDAAAQAACRPDGMQPTPNVATPYCDAYDANGREKLGDGRTRRIIGYFTSWRTGANGQARYLAGDIPWAKVTHVNYAFAHIDETHRVSVGNAANPQNPAIGMEWPGVAGAQMDPQFPYKGHLNLLNKFKKQYPHVKTLVSIGGWTDTGGYTGDDGVRVASGGFYTMTVTANNAINQAAIDTFADSVVAFLRQYGFDGADIDYEYPTSMNDAGHPLDWAIANPRRAALMRGYVALMKTLREKLDAAAAQDGRYYLLTAAVPASGYLLRGMEAFPVAQYLDYINTMSYDLHGSWNRYVGPNAALFDDGRDAELAAAGVYTTPQYAGIGYLNTDWAYHYYRGAMPAGRINIGVPYYTRGWRGVTGGTNGLWGSAAASGGCPGGLAACGQGAVGVDNLWHDLENGQEVPAGSNPMWHAKNLEAGIVPSYLGDYGLPPAPLAGTYARHYDATLVAPWLWNAQTGVFLSTEDAESSLAKANFIAERGIGGVMIWELAGDYAWDPARRGGQGEYTVGATLTGTYHDRFATAAPYGNRRTPAPAVAGTLAATVALEQFDLGDSNYPISPKLRITNLSTTAIPAGALFEFDMGTSAPATTVTNWSGATLSVVSQGHTGNNVGGLDGDHHRIRVSSGWDDVPPGDTFEVEFVYQLPMSMPTNFTVTFGGQTYALADATAVAPGDTNEAIFDDGFE